MGPGSVLWCPAPGQGAAGADWSQRSVWPRGRALRCEGGAEPRGVGESPLHRSKPACVLCVQLLWGTALTWGWPGGAPEVPSNSIGSGILSSPPNGWLVSRRDAGPEPQGAVGLQEGLLPDPADNGERPEPRNLSCCRG